MGSHKAQKTKRRVHPFAYHGLERVIHERARLSVLTSLLTHSRGLAFGDLKQLCGLTDGNLSQHLRVLQLAQMVEISKGYGGSRPQTFSRITAEGRKRYLEYLTVLEQVLLDGATAIKPRAIGKPKRGAVSS